MSSTFSPVRPLWLKAILCLVGTLFVCSVTSSIAYAETANPGGEYDGIEWTITDECVLQLGNPNEIEQSEGAVIPSTFESSAAADSDTFIIKNVSERAQFFAAGGRDIRLSPGETIELPSELRNDDVIKFLIKEGVLVIVKTDKEVADAVTAQIGALGDITSLEQAPAVTAAREGYDALTDEQKQLVTNLAILIAAEQEIAMLQKQADDVAAARVKSIGDGEYSISGLVNECGLSIGDSLEIGQNTTLIIDMDFSLESIVPSKTDNNALTIRGDKSLVLDKGINLGGNQSSFTQDSGNLRIVGTEIVNKYPSPNGGVSIVITSYAGICAADISINGGNLQVALNDSGALADTASITKQSYLAGLETANFQLSGGDVSILIDCGAVGFDGKAFGIFGRYSQSISVSGGALNVSVKGGDAKGIACYSSEWPTVTITGGSSTITVEGGATVGCSCGSFQMVDGVVDIDVSEHFGRSISGLACAALLMSGGSLEAKANGKSVADGIDLAWSRGTSKIEISGGNVTAIGTTSSSSGWWGIGIDHHSIDKVNIVGGTLYAKGESRNAKGQSCGFRNYSDEFESDVHIGGNARVIVENIGGEQPAIASSNNWVIDGAAKIEALSKNGNGFYTDKALNVEGSPTVQFAGQGNDRGNCAAWVLGGISVGDGLYISKPAESFIDGNGQSIVEPSTNHFAKEVLIEPTPEANRAAADAIIAQIAALGEVASLEQAADVAAVRAGYEALTDDQKALIGEDELAKLTQAEETIAKLQADREAADAVQELIDALPAAENISFEDAEDINAAREAYEDLTDEQKALVDTSRLEAAEQRLEELDDVHLVYAAGVEGSTKWQSDVRDGAMAGTAGKGLRMEGLQVKLENQPFEGDIVYEAQLQSEGWKQGEVKNGATAGYNPKKSGGLRVEAVKINLTGEMAEHYDVWYHLQVQRFGWMGWAKNGEVSGTVGYSFRVEAIEVVLLPKGSPAPAIGHKVATDEINMLSFVRARSYDNKVWQGAKGEGDVSGTRKQTKTCVRVGLAASSFSAAGIDKGNSYIQVRVYQNGKWSAWSKKDDQEVGTKGGKPITGIQARLTGKLAEEYDLYYRVEVKEPKFKGAACWLGWAKNGATAGQSNLNLEQLEFSLVPKGETAPPNKASGLKDTTAHAKQRWVLERWPCDYPKAAYRF